MKFRGPDRKRGVVTRVLAFVLSFVLIALLAQGWYTNQRIGDLTYGPTTDFWAIAIALSNIEYGLNGQIGYRKVSEELAKSLTTTGSDLKVHDAGTAALLQRPDLITRAIRSAAAISKDQLQPASLQNGDYVTTYYEDMGYPLFYNAAFRLFGYDAYSTHYLYVAILALSCLIFSMSYFNSNVKIATLLATIAGLYIACNTSVMNTAQPSLAANRFLSTLGIVPTLHIFWIMIDARRWTPARFVALVAQAVLLVIAINLRFSAVWMLIGLACTAGAVLMLRWLRLRQSIRSGPSEPQEPMNLLRPAVICGFVMLALVGTTAIRQFQLDPIYATDDVLPYHVRWHSAWLGLTVNPDWPQRKPHNDLPNIVNDDVGHLIFMRHMQNHQPNVPITSPTTGGLLKTGLMERVLRKEFLTFAKDNPTFIIKTYLWYKPIALAKNIGDLVRSISISGHIVAIIVIIILSVLLKGSGCPRTEVALGFILLVAASTLAPLWAFAFPHVLADQFVMFALLAVLFIAYLASTLLAGVNSALIRLMSPVGQTLPEPPAHHSSGDVGAQGGRRHDTATQL